MLSTMRCARKRNNDNTARSCLNWFLLQVCYWQRYLSRYRRFPSTLNFVGGLTPSQQAVFGQAEHFWESVLIGYQPGITIPSVTIDAEGNVIDGVGGILGSAGPSLSIPTQASRRLCAAYHGAI